MALVAVMQEVALNGRLLKRVKTLTVSNGKKKETMTQEFDFLANVLLVSISTEKNSTYDGPYRTLLVKLGSGVIAYVWCHENRDMVAKLTPGRFYSFEGHKKTGLRSLALTCTAFYTEPLVLTPAAHVEFPGLVTDAV
jgi:hypothetical protein